MEWYCIATQYQLLVEQEQKSGTFKSMRRIVSALTFTPSTSIISRLFFDARGVFASPAHVGVYAASWANRAIADDGKYLEVSY